MPLTHINLPPTVIEIESGVFSGCGSLVVVELCEGLRTIASSAFILCMSLVHINLPSSVAKIGLRAFAFCCGR
ncbi:hypothetical protein ACHAWF_015279 [Thalassiosira exigua]